MRWFLVVAIVLSACSTESVADEDVGGQEVAAVAAAIEGFPAFGRDVEPLSVVVISARFDQAAIKDLVGPGKSVVASRPASGAYWRVNRAVEVNGYWEVEMESNGLQVFFAGSQFFEAQDDGSMKAVTPEVVGVTPTTSVS